MLPIPNKKHSVTEFRDHLIINLFIDVIKPNLLPSFFAMVTFIMNVEELSMDCMLSTVGSKIILETPEKDIIIAHNHLEVEWGTYINTPAKIAEEYNAKFNK